MYPTQDFLHLLANIKTNVDPGYVVSIGGDDDLARGKPKPLLDQRIMASGRISIFILAWVINQ